MKTNQIKTLILRTVATAAIPTMTALAQPGPIPPPPGGPPPPLANQQIETVQGTVSQYLMNPNGEVDGLLPSDGTQVHFPPHMSADLTQTVGPTNNISAQGVHENGVHFRAFTISNLASGQSVVESRPSQFNRPLPPELRGVELKPLQVEVKVVLFAPRGETDGAVLDNGTIIRMPPDVGMQFSALLQAGQSISATGYGTENQFGRCLQATAIGAGGQPLTQIYGATLAAPPPGPVAPPPPTAQ
jgi:hypothetical protein